jgi:lipopolysaccharide assembly protein A
MHYIVWLFRAAIFFILFAFALNNQQTVSVHWFFGHEWRTPLVFVVLAAFALGCALTLIALTPRWWRYRKQTRPRSPAANAKPPLSTSAPDTSSDSVSVVPHGI